MPAWGAFVGLTAVLVVLLLVLSRTSQRVLEEAVVDGDGEPKVEDDATSIAEGVAAPTDEGTAAPTAEETAAPTGEDPDVPDAENATAPTAEDLDERRQRASPDPGQSVELDAERTPGSIDGDGERHDSSGVAIDSEVDDGGSEVDDGHRLPERATRSRITTRALLGNVVVSQALFLGLLVAAAWWTAIPASAFGLGADALTLAHAGYGVIGGILIYGVNEVGAAASERFGFSAPERLRSAMAPTDAAEWALLVLLVLPIIAVFEELLFRGALVGVVHAGFGISPWLLAVASSAVFGLGHGAQGRVGVVVTALLGFVLAAVFVVTGSLLVVIVAHYVINVLEFVVREGLGWEPLVR